MPAPPQAERFPDGFPARFGDAVYGVLDRLAPAPYVESTLAQRALERGDVRSAQRYALRLPASPSRDELLARIAGARGQDAAGAGILSCCVRLGRRASGGAAACSYGSAGGVRARATAGAASEPPCDASRCRGRSAMADGSLRQPSRMERGTGQPRRNERGCASPSRTLSLRSRWRRSPSGTRSPPPIRPTYSAERSRAEALFARAADSRSRKRRRNRRFGCRRSAEGRPHRRGKRT